VQAKQLPCQGQRASGVRIHNQEFFFNTKSTHVLSVTDESDSERPRASVRPQGRRRSPLGRETRIRPRNR
jgi:hypothetical protein